MLATFQLRAHGGSDEAAGAPDHDHGRASGSSTPTAPAADAGATGGLAEFDAAGRLLRVASASTALDPAVRPYSLAVLPTLDRVVTTSSDMRGRVRSRTVQLWRLSDLRLLANVALPAGPRGDEQWNPGEPRVLADGRTVLVSTFSCGLYRLAGLDGARPSAAWVHSWAAPDPADRFATCALAVVAGHYWVQANGPERAVVSLDVRDAARPREVGRLTLAPDEIPHWLALEPGGARLVVTGNGALRGRVLLARLDRRSGALRLDSTFSAPGAPRPGVDLRGRGGPGPAPGQAVPHGAVFSRP